MANQIAFDDLIDYTHWQRQKWFDWFRKQGDAALAVSVGPNGDGRFSTVGEVVRHIFSAEVRYADRLAGRPLTDVSAVPAGNIEALVELSRKSRSAMKDLLATFPENEWDMAHDYQIGKLEVRATPRKVVTHAIMHEIRHWSQIATLLRLNGLAVEPNDFLISPAMGS